MNAENFPQDEIDSIAPAIGRRRLKRTRGSKLLEFFAYFTVSAVVAGGSLFAYQTFIGGKSSVDVNAVKSNTTTTDPLRVNETSILNGTSTAGESSIVAQKLVDKGWNVVTADTTPFGVTATKTTIFINSADLNDAAKAMVSDLGNYPIQVSSQYIDPITVVLGNDYK